MTKTMQRVKQSDRAQDSGWFRRVLGHYPSGVTVITTVSAEGRPEAMVVGSFTSVSLDPPLVAFLPSRASKSWQRMRQTGRFCVNILAAADEHLCRQLASHDEHKFDGVNWKPGPTGSPIVDGAVAWIDCEADAVHPGGDHDIVVGRVVDLDLGESRTPLLFFQGGYGSFTAHTLVAANSGLTAQLAIAERARALLEGAARTIEGQVGIVHCDGDALTLLAVTGNPAGAPEVSAALGEGVPVAAPVGIWWASHAGEPARQRWLSGIADPGQREKAVAALEQIRADGGLTVGLDVVHDGVTRLLQDRAGGVPRQPAEEARAIAHLARDPRDFIASRFAPGDTAGDHPEVRALWAPVLDAHGTVVLGVVASGFSADRPIQDVARQLLHLAEGIGALAPHRSGETA